MGTATANSPKAWIAALFSSKNPYFTLAEVALISSSSSLSLSKENSPPYYYLSLMYSIPSLEAADFKVTSITLSKTGPNYSY